MEMTKTIHIFLNEEICYEEAFKTYQINWCAYVGKYSGFCHWVVSSSYVEDWIIHKLSKAQYEVFGVNYVREMARELKERVKQMYIEEREKRCK